MRYRNTSIPSQLEPLLLNKFLNILITFIFNRNLKGENVRLNEKTLKLRRQTEIMPMIDPLYTILAAKGDIPLLRILLLLLLILTLIFRLT